MADTTKSSYNYEQLSKRVGFENFLCSLAGLFVGTITTLLVVSATHQCTPNPNLGGSTVVAEYKPTDDLPKPQPGEQTRGSSR